MRLECTGNEIRHTLTCDRLASERGVWSVLVASVSGNATQVRSFGAALHSNNLRLSMRAYEIPQDTGVYFGAMTKDFAGYRVHYHRLAYHDWQAVAIAKRPGLILSATHDGLWAELTSPRFTTPVLRSWVPWLSEELQRVGLLEEVQAVGCRPAVLTCTTERLDEIVSKGLREGALKIERRAA